MKIFNWVHRRFLHKYEVSEDVKKAEHTGNAKDNLLDQNAAVDSVFDGWNEGILAIGTFGFDPSLLKEFNDMLLHHEELSNIDDDTGEEGIEFPLVVKACKNGFFHDKKDDHMTQCVEEVSTPNDHVDDTTDPMKKEKKGGESRITLADLFSSADSDKNKDLLSTGEADQVLKAHSSPPDHESNTKHDSCDDQRVTLISKKKKTKDDINAARPIKKINRMMRKMLKKKIHPDHVENQKDKRAFEAIRV